MTRPDHQTLYVLQNQFGLIKIGRSLDADRRRRDLQRQEGCAICVVATLERSGHLEEATHLALADHALEGEWFDGTGQSRAAVAAALPQIRHWSWAYNHDAEGAAKWLEAFYGRRDVQSEVRLFRRMLTVHLRKAEAGAWADAAVYQLLTLFETGDMPGVSMGRENGKTVALIYERGAKQPICVPAYSTNLLLARELWPAGEKIPEGLDALSLCISAMELRLKVLLSEAKKSEI